MGRRDTEMQRDTHSGRWGDRDTEGLRNPETETGQRPTPGTRQTWAEQPPPRPLAEPGPDNAPLSLSRLQSGSWRVGWVPGEGQAPGGPAPASTLGLHPRTPPSPSASPLWPPGRACFLLCREGDRERDRHCEGGRVL